MINGTALMENKISRRKERMRKMNRNWFPFHSSDLNFMEKSRKSDIKRYEKNMVSIASTLEWEKKMIRKSIWISEKILG